MIVEWSSWLSAASHGVSSIVCPFIVNTQSEIVSHDLCGILERFVPPVQCPRTRLLLHGDCTESVPTIITIGVGRRRAARGVLVPRYALSHTRRAAPPANYLVHMSCHPSQMPGTSGLSNNHVIPSRLHHRCTMFSSSCRLQPAFRIAIRRYPALRCGVTSRARPGCDQTRNFSYSPRWQIRTKEMNDELLRDLKVNQGRLMEDIHYTCQWGKGERWGEYVYLRRCC